MARAVGAQVSMFVTPRGRRPDPARCWVDLVCEILRGQPKLDGGLCQHRPELFDAAADGRETQPALALCAACPVASRCADWASSLPAGELTGVLAGRVFR